MSISKSGFRVCLLVITETGVIRNANRNTISFNFKFDHLKQIESTCDLPDFISLIAI